jgi:hypothetical protein
MTALTSTIIDPDFTPFVDLIARLRPGATIEQTAQICSTALWLARVSTHSCSVCLASPR